MRVEEIINKKFFSLLIVISLIFGSALTPIDSKAFQSSNFLIRVLISENIDKADISQNNKDVCLLFPDDGEFILPVKDETIVSFSSKGEKETYLLKIKETNSLSSAIKFGQDQIIPIIKNSDLNIFIYPINNSLFNIELGPLTSKEDAEFIKKLLSNIVPTIEIVKILSNFSTLGVKLDQKIFLRSYYSYSEKPTKVFTLKLDDSLFLYKDRSYSGMLEIYKQKDAKFSIVNSLDIEEYLRGVVPSEMPSSWSYDALCAQTVAARTYAFSRLLSSRKNGAFYDVCDTTHCQVYLGARTTPTTDKAIKDTNNLILTYNGYPIEAVFHSSSGGQTENNENVWQGSPCPYLRGVPSPGEEISPYFTWYKAYKTTDFLGMLNSYFKKNGIKEINSLNSIEIKECGCSPRVKKVLIKSEGSEIILSGYDIQSIFSLKSTWFNFLIYTIKDEMPAPPIIKYFKEQNNQNVNLPLEYIYIYGRGWGHGIGLSQYGAYAMAREGSTYKDILSHYYQGTKIEPLTNYNIQSSSLFTEEIQSGYSKLYFEPSQINLYKDEVSSDITLRVNSTANIYGISFTIPSDDKLINIDPESIKEGTFLKADGKETIFLKSIVQEGIKIGIVRSGRVGGVSGEGDLLYFNIKGLNKGKTSVKLTEIQINDSQLNPISFDCEQLEVEVKERDITPPKTIITSYPDKFTNKKTVYFEWSGTDNITDTKSLFYSYRLNDEPWSQFSQETSRYFNLVYDGNYKFEVKARDEAGNIDPDPPVYEFALDSTPPIIKLSSYQEKTFEKFITFNGETEPDATLLLNGEILQLDSSGKFSYIGELKIGDNLFRFIAIDKASNSRVLDITITREAVKQTVIKLTIGSKKALVNEEVLNLDVAPFIEEERTFVPLRFIAESFQAKVDWNAQLKKIDITLEHPLIKKKIELRINSKIAYINGKETTLEVPPFIIPPGRTVVPLRFIAESFDSKVDWEPLVKNIIITFPKDELIEE
jgi:stage II sporulation protein D